MVKGALFKKSIQDMKKSLSQFVSILIMAMVAVSIVVGLDSIWKTLETQSSHLYESAHLSDLWVTVKNPSETRMWKVGQIDGVEKAEKRLVVNATAKIDGEPTLQVYAMPSENTLDVPYLESGMRVSKQGAVLDELFAKANHLSVGDRITIKVNDKDIYFTIEALALSGEHVYSLKDTTAMVPNPKSYGFIVVDIDRIASAYGGYKPYNQIAVRLNSSAKEQSIQEQMDQVFGDDLIGIITRTENKSINNVESKVYLFRTLSTVFPFMFFLVTALITLSTMTRIVEDQRNQIGILKALGYSKRSIMWHYTSYGVYVGTIGSLLGILIGPNVIGRILIDKLKFLYTFPSYQLSLNIPNIVISSILIILCTGGISCYACTKLLGDMPAVLLRDKPPKKGSHIFLERIPELWNRMKFSQKLIARNTLKNKSRMIMSILGVMGCTGLIIGAFTLYDMVTGISKTTYEKVYVYDQKVMLEDRTTERDIQNLNLDGVVQDVEETMVQMNSSTQRRMAGVTVLSPESPLVRLQDADGNLITLPQEGIAITRKLAKIMGVEKGDSIQLKRSDDSYISVPVNQIVYMAAGQGVYISKDYWESIGQDYKPTAVLVRWNTKNTTFLNSDYVKSYVDRTTLQTDFEGGITVVYIAAFMLIISGSILAFVVLYNMGILNFFERVRDLATLKVLGFYPKEIRPLVLMENIFSTLIGILFGIPIGKIISQIIADGFGDDLDLIGRITLDKIMLAALLTMAFAAIVNNIVSRKIKSIDMLQALKSVE
ncbi:ABC transporter permease [Clostridium minihomine]|uniref:ABC transporter permease n=1 Tax=Clostridium minihomine TaxID=2045012 RepID=UPI000C7736CD|nr:ABC transporter permease [Clostridium minihomine]